MRFKNLSKLTVVAVLALSGALFAAETAAPAADAAPAAAKPAKAPKAAKVKAPKSMTLVGMVVSTDAIANTVVVSSKGKKEDQTFSVMPTSKIMKGKTELKLADLEKDAKVTVTYMEENGAMNASAIKVWNSKKGKAAKAAEPAAK